MLKLFYFEHDGCLGGCKLQHIKNPHESSIIGALVVYICDRSQPCRLKFFTDRKVVQISCGARHSAALTSASQVMSHTRNTGYDSKLT